MDKSQIVKDCDRVWGDRYSYQYVDYSKTKKFLQRIICPMHGEFRLSLSDHLGKRKRGCQQCGRDRCGRKNSIKNSWSQEEFISLCIKAHGSEYSYQDTIYNGALNLVTVACRIHGDFKIRADRHKSGKGCQKCMVDRRTSEKYLTSEQWLERCRLSHNTQYDYQYAAYIGTEAKVKIGCPTHGYFEQNAGHHMRGSDCPICMRQSHASKISMKWLASLQISHLEFEKHLTDINKYADGFDPLTNTVYLFHGDYWHANPDIFDPDHIHPTIGLLFGSIYQKTLTDDDRIREAGYNLVVMWENDWVTSQSSPFGPAIALNQTEGSTFP